MGTVASCWAASRPTPLLPHRRSKAWFMSQPAWAKQAWLALGSTLFQLPGPVAAQKASDPEARGLQDPILPAELMPTAAPAAASAAAALGSEAGDWLEPSTGSIRKQALM